MIGLGIGWFYSKLSSLYLSCFGFISPYRSSIFSIQKFDLENIYIYIYKYHQLLCLQDIRRKRKINPSTHWRLGENVLGRANQCQWTSHNDLMQNRKGIKNAISICSLMFNIYCNTKIVVNKTFFVSPSWEILFNIGIIYSYTLYPNWQFIIRQWPQVPPLAMTFTVKTPPDTLNMQQMWLWCNTCHEYHDTWYVRYQDSKQYH